MSNRICDGLGSTRLLTNYPTPTVAECDAYYPFGEQVSCGGTSTTTHKFTGYERDTESGLDNAQARYNSSSLGRFMSPDPIGNFIADATNPQTWNLYTYVNNSPLTMTDPTGLDSITPGPDPCPPDSPAGAICTTTKTKAPSDDFPYPVTGPGDCMPLIFVRGDPFDAEFPDIAFEDATQSTFCGSGGDFAQRYVDGGGGTGSRRHGSGKPQAQAPTSRPWYKSCGAQASGDALKHGSIDAIGVAVPEAGVILGGLTADFNDGTGMGVTAGSTVS